jgi:hypothetical protein
MKYAARVVISLFGFVAVSCAQLGNSILMVPSVGIQSQVERTFTELGS